MLSKWLLKKPITSSVHHMAVRRLEGHGFDHARKVGRNRTIVPDKLRISIPVPVQERALKRHRNPKNASKELDKLKMRDKKVIISSKRSELNHRMAEQYGSFERMPLGNKFRFKNQFLSSLMCTSEWRLAS